MKKQLIVMMLAGLAMTTVFASGTDNTQTQSNQSMEAQPQNGTSPAMSGSAVSGAAAMSGTGAQQDNNGSQD
jgi:uncharacterized protein YdeI (BOF family)